MPTAPTYGQQKASTAALPGVFKQPNRTAADYGATDLPAKMAAFAEQVFVKESDQRADDAENNAVAMKRDAMVKRQAEYQGVNAVEGQTKLQEDFKAIDEKMLADLQGNPRATSRYQRSAKSTDLSFQPQITGWVLSERDKAAQNTYRSSVETSLKKAASLAPQATLDAASLQAYTYEISKAIEANSSLMRMQGASPEVIEADNAKVEGAVHAQVVANFLEINDVSKAIVWFDKYRKTMDPTSAAKLEGDIQRRSVKNQGEAFGTALASKALAERDFTSAGKKTVKRGEIMAAINASDLPAPEKSVAMTAATKMLDTVEAADKADSANLANTAIERFSISQKSVSAAGMDTSTALANQLHDFMSTAAWSRMSLADQKAVINAAVNPPEDQYQSAIYEALSKQLKEGRQLSPGLLSGATPEMREYFKSAASARANDAAWKQHSDISNIAEKVMKDYAKANGKKDSEYLKHAPALIARIQANPDLAIELAKNQTLALGTAKKLVDSDETEPPDLHPRFGPRNMERIKEAIANGDTDALKRFAGNVVSWGIGYESPAARAELIDPHLNVLAQGSGQNLEYWRTEARKQLGFVAPQTVDARAVELMVAAIDKANATVLNEQTVNAALDSWYNPVTGPSNPAGTLIKRAARAIVPMELNAIRATEAELNRGFPAYRAGVQFLRDAERGMWQVNNYLAEAWKYPFR